MVRRALVVINPSSNDFEAQKKWPVLEGFLRRAVEIGVVETDPDDELTHGKISEAIDASYDRVIAIGGDGTAHLVLNALMSCGVDPIPEIAIIPFGTANDVAKSLRLPINNLEKLAAIATGDSTAGLDIGCVTVRREDGDSEPRIFVDAVTVGMDADVLARRRDFRDLKGYLSYIPALAERAVEQQSMDVRLTIDGRSLDARVFNLVINNVPIYAGELEMPESKADDGMLDVYLFDRLEYASKFMTMAIKQADILKLGVGEVLDELTDNQRTFHGKDVKIRLASPRRIQVDGEVFGEADELEATVLRQLVVAVP